MPALQQLRGLLEQHQHAALKSACLAGDPTDPAVRVLRLLACAHLGEFAEVERGLRDMAAEQDRLDGDARVDLAAVLIVLMRIDEAAAMLESARDARAAGGGPEPALLEARLGVCRMLQGRVDEARALLAQSADLEPDRVSVWVHLARLNLHGGGPSAAGTGIEPDPAAAQRAIDRGLAVFEAQHACWPEAIARQSGAQLRGLQVELWIAAGDDARAEQWMEEQREALAEDDWAALVAGAAMLLASRARHAQAEDLLKNALKHHPQNLMLLEQSSELAQVQGRSHQAIALIRRAIAAATAQGKDGVALWVRLSGACLHTSTAQSRPAAERAMALADALTEGDAMPPERIAALRAQAKNALAQVESQAGHYDAAETLFREVLADNPHMLPALQGLGQQLMQLGRLDEAVALFERVRQIDPARGYASLITARKVPEDARTLEMLERMARQPGIEGPVRSGMLFQLASAWEKNKDHERAFALADEANAASRKLLPYDPKAHRQSCARIRHAFTRALYEHRPGCGLDSTLPVFVLGMPRSGTTLVEQILAGHPLICGAGELGLIPRTVAGLERWERHVGSGRHYPDCVDDLSARVTQGIARNLLEELQAFDPQARHVIDKLPHNFENIGLIKFLFPNAKIISVRRDPRDIAISNYFTDYQAKHGGMGFAYDLTWIGEQLADHNLLMHHWHQVFPGEILEVRYEDVVEDTEGQARRMLDYIGVDWDPQVLGFSELDRPVKTASVWQVRQPIYKTSTARWARYQAHLAPLIRGTNAKITWDPIEMVTLPVPDLLTEGVDLYKQGALDEAELRFGKLLHHVPEHAAANFMLGLVLARKGHPGDAIARMEKGLRKCPWNPKWREDLIRACEMSGQHDKAEALRRKARTEAVQEG